MFIYTLPWTKRVSKMRFCRSWSQVWIMYSWNKLLMNRWQSLYEHWAFVRCSHVAFCNVSCEKGTNAELKIWLNRIRRSHWLRVEGRVDWWTPSDRIITHHALYSSKTPYNAVYIQFSCRDDDQRREEEKFTLKESNTNADSHGPP